MSLRDSNQGMRVNDSWIAATAIALRIPLITQDEAIPQIQGLAMILV